jgi:hypothetical protein
MVGALILWRNSTGNRRADLTPIISIVSRERGVLHQKSFAVGQG